ncbi:glycosyltransferase family 87 protein [Chryseobacterium flavum]|uniref:glycosyltransferase family 87 protein n=1 Tax=Chryseobacterium flavum TaxID=415851 RepID=UPI0028A977A1|nr:glycosyltransferase family 87 protein [Chryseobacterium flavum]
MKEKISSFIVNPKYIFGVYIITAIATALSKYSRGERAYNNYLIFKNVFFNTLKERNLYLSYPEYLDVNHYGIFFSFIIAPFAMLPDWAGLVLWNVANVLVFLLAVKKLPFSERNKSFFLWLCLQEFITSSLHQQFNVALAGLIILSAAHIYRKEEVQSALSICIGFFVKIYGIVGLSSFFFIENKKKFILSFIGISLAFLAIPMLYSSVHFGLQSYVDWFVELKHKNMENQQLGNFQDISLMGFVRRVLGNPAIPNMLFLAIGVPLFFLPYLRISQYKYLGFKLSVLASSLLFVVLFSSSSEPPTYIIAVAGAVIWFLIQEKKSPLVIGMLVFLILFTCFSTSDLFPKSVKDNFILKYSIKALPCIVIWFRLTWELLTKKYTDKLSY